MYILSRSILHKFIAIIVAYTFDKSYPDHTYTIRYISYIYVLRFRHHNSMLDVSCAGTWSPVTPASSRRSKRSLASAARGERSAPAARSPLRTAPAAASPTSPAAPTAPYAPRAPSRRTWVSRSARPAPWAISGRGRASRSARAALWATTTPCGAPGAACPAGKTG